MLLLSRSVKITEEIEAGTNFDLASIDLPRENQDGRPISAARSIRSYRVNLQGDWAVLTDDGEVVEEPEAGLGADLAHVGPRVLHGDLAETQHPRVGAAGRFQVPNTHSGVPSHHHLPRRQEDPADRVDPRHLREEGRLERRRRPMGHDFCMRQSGRVVALKKVA